jgi:hypothetical protein
MKPTRKQYRQHFSTIIDLILNLHHLRYVYNMVEIKAVYNLNYYLLMH